VLRTVRVKRGIGLGAGGLGADGRGLIVTLGAGGLTGAAFDEILCLYCIF
jgi:hypothetical protein